MVLNQLEFSDGKKFLSKNKKKGYKKIRKIILTKKNKKDFLPPISY